MFSAQFMIFSIIGYSCSSLRTCITSLSTGGLTFCLFNVQDVRLRRMKSFFLLPEICASRSDLIISFFRSKEYSMIVSPSSNFITHLISPVILNKLRGTSFCAIKSAHNLIASIVRVLPVEFSPTSKVEWFNRIGCNIHKPSVYWNSVSLIYIEIIIVNILGLRWSTGQGSRYSRYRGGGRWVGCLLAA